MPSQDYSGSQLCSRYAVHPTSKSFSQPQHTTGRASVSLDVYVRRHLPQPRKRHVFSLHGSGKSGAKRRSEEHTSELQSRENLVCRLLLEKKKEKTCTFGPSVQDDTNDDVHVAGKSKDPIHANH